MAFDNNFMEIENMIPVPAMKLDKDGKIESANSLIGEVFLYDDIRGGDIFALARIKCSQLKDAVEKGIHIEIDRNDKVFKILPKALGENMEDGLLLYFIDITHEKTMERKYENEKSCICVVNIDNFDELQGGSYGDKNMAMVSQIDKIIRTWGNEVEGAVTRYKDSVYCIVFSQEKCMEQMESRFLILDQIRNIDSGMDFPITLSIGVGLNGKNHEENGKFADQALELALGRGGDQAVVKDRDVLSYFGGKAQTVEKSNKGKSRMIAHAFKQLVKTASKVMIMGHKNPDMDAFGAAMGISRIGRFFNKDTYIVLENYGEALDLLYSEAKKSGQYDILSRKKAMEIIDDNTLVVVVDTHKPSITECPELLGDNVKKVVIDHHRKGEEVVENPTLVYMEPYTSSTCELVTEILQYTMDRKEVSKLEAEGLLAGIFVDTNKFSTKTGVRTFEAAGWLRRAGADLSNVKKLFQVDKQLFMDRIYGIANAEFNENGIAYSLCRGESPNTQMICSIVADELLTIRGIRGAFAIGVNHRGKTVISARSVGELNVHIIMEKFQGGGHLNAAGAQTDQSPLEVIAKLKEIMEDK